MYPLNSLSLSLFLYFSLSLALTLSFSFSFALILSLSFSSLLSYLPLRDWIQSLSAYATAGFLRGAELGEELGEWWMVDNAAVYLWNYSRPLLAACEYRTLLPAFQTLVDTLRRTGHYG